MTNEEMLNQLPAHAWRGYRVILDRDLRSGKVVALPAFAWSVCPDPVDWDGSGIALVSERLEEDRLKQRAPEIGDEIEIDGVDFVIVNRAPYERGGGICVMRASLEAHRLALFHLTYFAQLEARHWYTRAERRLHHERFGGYESPCH